MTSNAHLLVVTKIEIGRNAVLINSGPPKEHPVKQRAIYCESRVHETGTTASPAQLEDDSRDARGARR